jgi:hypothetical protein
MPAANAEEREARRKAARKRAVDKPREGPAGGAEVG